jgi:hypothetical protein
MSEIPVGETITLEWPYADDWLGAEFTSVSAEFAALQAKPVVEGERIPAAKQRPYSVVIRQHFEQIKGRALMQQQRFSEAGQKRRAAVFLESLTLAPDKPTGKPPPTGILTVHEGRVGGVPMCSE